MKIFLQFSATLILVSILFFVSSAWGQNADRASALESAGKIVREFGDGRSIGEEGFSRYLNQKIAFPRIDTDKSGAIDFYEFTGGFLYAQPGDKSWVVDMKAANDLFREQVGNSTSGGASGLPGIDAESLRVQNDAWRVVIESLSNTHWERAGGTGDSLDIESVANYLLAEQSKRAALELPSATSRTSALEEIINQHGVSEHRETIMRFTTQELFDKADQDISGSIDILEFIKAFNQPSVTGEFVKIASRGGVEAPSGFLIDRSELEGILLDPKHAGDGTWLLIDTNTTMLLEGVSPTAPEPIRVESYQTKFTYVEENARKAKKKEPNKQVSGWGFINGRGIVFGDRRYDQISKKETIDYTKPAITFRVIKDFTKNGPNAQPGTFTWTNGNDDDSDVTVDMAARFDYFHPSLYKNDGRFNTTIAWGGESGIAQGTGKNRTRSDKYFLLADMSVVHDEVQLLPASSFQIGPVYEKDRFNDFEKVTGLIEWKPMLFFDPVISGTYLPLDGGNNVSFYWQPILATEFSEVVSGKAKKGTIDDSFLRYGIETGLRFRDRIELGYELKQRHSFDDFEETFLRHSVVLSWNFDDDGRYKITGKYEKGEDTPDFKDVDVWSIGLGIRF